MHDGALSNSLSHAVQALEILLVTKAAEGGSASVLHGEDIKLFAERCNDVSVLTRKQAMSSLSALLLAYPQNTKLQVGKQCRVG